MQSNPDTPPSYDTVTSEVNHQEPFKDSKDHDAKAQQSPQQPPYNERQAFAPGPSMQVFHYVNPQSGHHLVSPLPPNHPEMICLQEGGHDVHTKFGLLGILAAVFWFPLGIGLCLLDRRVQCRRCGMLIDDGMSC